MARVHELKQKPGWIAFAGRCSDKESMTDPDINPPEIPTPKRFGNSILTPSQPDVLQIMSGSKDDDDESDEEMANWNAWVSGIALFALSLNTMLI